MRPDGDLDGFVEFSRWHARSGDVDPVYPVLRAIGERWRLDREALLDLALLYVAYYDLGSALTVWTEMDGWAPGPVTDEQARLPTGVERRNLRGGDPMHRHLASLEALAEAHGSLHTWLYASLPADRRAAWVTVQQRVQEAWGNGRWASYKVGELLAEVCDLPVTATDAGHAWSSGPRKGLALLYPTVDGNGRKAVATLDAQTDDLAARLEAAGIDARVERVETHLCDFHSLVKGRYYVGHDIDLMWEQISRPHVPAEVRALVADARAAAFDARWLVECTGGTGVRRPLLDLYRTRRVIRWWEAPT